MGGKGSGIKGHVTPRPVKVKIVKKNTGLSESEAGEMVDTVNRYAAFDHGLIRAVQIGEGDFSEFDEDVLDQAERDGMNLEKLISVYPKYSGESHRGIHMSDPSILKKNQVVDMKGTSSWSKDRNVARSFGNVRFNLKKSSRAISIEDISNRSDEKEILISKDSRFRITNTSVDSDGKWDVEVEEI